MPIENRNLAAGTRLVARYKKEDRTCEVVETADGLRYRLDDGTEHKSPSSAGKAVTGGACNGWVFWSIEGTNPSKDRSKKDATAKQGSAAKKPLKRKAAKKSATAQSKKPNKSKSMRAAAAGDASYGCGDCDQTFPSIEEATEHLAFHSS